MWDAARTRAFRRPSVALSRLVLLLAAFAADACAESARTPSATATPSSAPLTFAFGALDGSVVSGEKTRGRVTALLFATSYDLPSQVAARRVNEVMHQHRPKINAACIVLEAADNAVLVETFRDSLHLDYPVAIADVVELRSSVFGDVDRVPTLVVLDRRGRERFRHFGVFEARELEQWLRDAE